MKRRLMDILRCPLCGERLNLKIVIEENEEVTRHVKEPICMTFCAMHNIISENGIKNSDYLDCHGCYGRDIREGFLFCPSCNVLYPIIKGVPRLIRNAYEEYIEFFFSHREVIGNMEGVKKAAVQLGSLDPSVFDRRSNESFSLQWEVYQYHDKTWFKDDVALRSREFLYSINLGEEELGDSLILDAGCGNGKLTASVSSYGAEVVGMDLSRSVERASDNCKTFVKEHSPFVHFVQGNIMEPPFTERAFDHIHTSGVLHHTPDTWQAFKSFLTLVRPGGHAYVQLYRKREAWVTMVNKVLRFFTTKMNVRFLYWLCYQMVPIHTAAVLVVAFLREEKSNIREASRRERAVSLFDHLSPRYQYRFTPEEVRKKFIDAGLLNIKDVTLANEARHMVAFVGEMGRPYKN